MPQLLFTENDTNRWRLYGVPNQTAFVKDGINDYVVHGHTGTVNTAQTGTKAAAYYRLEMGTGQETTLHLRLCDAPPAHTPFGIAFNTVFMERMREADEFYCARPVSRAPRPVPKCRDHLLRSSVSSADGGGLSIRSRLAVPLRIVPTTAGSDAATSARTGLPVASPGASGSVPRAPDTVMSLTARCFMASAPRQLAACASSRVWPKVGVSGARPGASRLPPYRPWLVGGSGRAALELCGLLSPRVAHPLRSNLTNGPPCSGQ